MSPRDISSPAGVPSDVKVQPLDDDVKRSTPEVGDAADEKSIRVGETEVDDLFQPLSGVEAYDGRRILTVRAVATGGILGSLVACSNLYLGTWWYLADTCQSLVLSTIRCGWLTTQ